MLMYPAGRNTTKSTDNTANTYRENNVESNEKYLSNCGTRGQSISYTTHNGQKFVKLMVTH